MSCELIVRRSFLATCAACVSAPLLHAQQAATSVPPDPQTVDDLVAANRILAQEGVFDAMGHVSVRHPRRPDRFLLARSVAPALVTTGDIMEYDLESRPIDARGRNSYQERFIHSEIYRVRQDVKAIVHCHTPSLVPFSISKVPLRPVFHMSSFVGEGVPVFEIRGSAGMTNMLVKDTMAGRALAQALGMRSAVLMRGHGAVVAAASLPLAVGRAVYLDMNAKIQMQAAMLGGQPTYLDAEEVRLATVPTQYDRAWELWKKQVSQAR